MLFTISLLAVSGCIAFCMFMFFKNKDIILKIQVASLINTLIIIFIAIYCYYINKPQYIDIALLYAIINYVSVLAFNRYFILNHQTKDEKK